MKFKYYLRGLGIGIAVTALLFIVSGFDKNDDYVRQRAKELGMVDGNRVLVGKVSDLDSVENLEENNSIDSDTEEPAELKRSSSPEVFETVSNTPVATLADKPDDDKTAKATDKKDESATPKISDTKTSQETKESDAKKATPDKNAIGDDSGNNTDSSSNGNKITAGDGLNKDSFQSQQNADSKTDNNDNPRDNTDAGNDVAHNKDADNDAAENGTEAVNDSNPTVTDLTDNNEPDGGDTEVLAVEGETVVLEVKPGNDSRTVAKALYKLGVVESVDSFDDYLCKNGYANKINVGKFNIPAGSDNKTIAEIITGRRR
ncbi:MAG: hypothetical protein K6F84_08600 [Lachnospiraceae bacterium]|nr:hypothetical protein [Lachnospiraceae bacterium]